MTITTVSVILISLLFCLDTFYVYLSFLPKYVRHFIVVIDLYLDSLVTIVLDYWFSIIVL